MQPGDVYWAELGGTGSEQRGRRPVIVVQRADVAFRSTRLVVPTSKSARALSWRVEVQVANDLTVALTEQVRPIAVERLREHIGRLDPDELRDVVARVKDLLPLTWS